MSMTAEEYMQKAERALSAAQLLLTNDALEGACNRAYYAMFDAAHAALLGAGIQMPESVSKTHRGLIGAFGQHLVKNNRIAGTLGKAINEVERLRRLADYTGDPVTLEEATWAVEQAGMFVHTIRDKFIPEVEINARANHSNKMKP